ncbi:hypothetical protein EDC01DRAFT_641192 [Geopyxis carbonaria]|nr:hypothetical protein EDC01DRAFT_641192 [Geopyxis carbonaria]
MAPLAEEKTFTVYLTGFGGFQRLDNNPSSLIASYFLSPRPPVCFTVSGVSYKIHIVAHPEPITVTYKAVDHVVPVIWKRNDWDYILHLGAGIQENGYILETVAHEKGYDKTDVDGRIPEAEEDEGVESVEYGCRGGKEGEGSGGYGKVFSTTFDVNYLCEFIKKREKTGDDDSTPFVGVSPSSDAGMYLCEYIFRASLLEAARKVVDSSRRVLFMHVPYGSSEDLIKQGHKFVMLLAEAMVRDGEGLKD